MKTDDDVFVNLYVAGLLITPHPSVNRFSKFSTGRLSGKFATDIF